VKHKQRFPSVISTNTLRRGDTVTQPQCVSYASLEDSCAYRIVQILLLSMLYKVYPWTIF